MTKNRKRDLTRSLRKTWKELFDEWFIVDEKNGVIINRALAGIENAIKALSEVN
jgi:hypothetical protein